MIQLRRLALMLSLCTLYGCSGPGGVIPEIEGDEWIDKPGIITGYLAASGAAPHLGNEAAARDSAAANGRAQLAAAIKAELNQLIEDWSKQAGDLLDKNSLSSYVNNENFTRQYVETVSAGGRILKYTKRGDTMYALLILDIENTKKWYDQLSKALFDNEIKQAAALYKTEGMKEKARQRFDGLRQERQDDQIRKIEALTKMYE